MWQVPSEILLGHEHSAGTPPIMSLRMLSAADLPSGYLAARRAWVPWRRPFQRTWLAWWLVRRHMVLGLLLLGGSARLLCLLPGRLNLIEHRRQVLQGEVLLIAGHHRCRRELPQYR